MDEICRTLNYQEFLKRKVHTFRNLNIILLKVLIYIIIIGQSTFASFFTSVKRDT